MPYLLPQIQKQLKLSLLNLTLGGEDARFPFFKFGRDVAFFVNKGLLADVIIGRTDTFSAADTDIVPKGFGIANFKGANAGALAFAGFEIGNPLLIVTDLLSQGIQLGVNAGTNQAAFGQGQGRALDKGLAQVYA